MQKFYYEDRNCGDEGDIEPAKSLVKRFRERAANPLNFVRRNDGTPAANYVVGVYSSFPDKDMPIKAVDFVERIELALEGHVFLNWLEKVKLPRHTMLILLLRAQNLLT